VLLKHLACRPHTLGGRKGKTPCDVSPDGFQKGRFRPLIEIDAIDVAVPEELRSMVPIISVNDLAVTARHKDRGPLTVQLRERSDVGLLDTALANGGARPKLIETHSNDGLRFTVAVFVDASTCDPHFGDRHDQPPLRLPDGTIVFPLQPSGKDFENTIIRNTTMNGAT
jgi:hypothetical protein